MGHSLNRLTFAFLAIGLALLCIDVRAMSMSEDKCLDKKYSKAKLVTHYVIPFLKDYDHQICNRLEGTCIYQKSGELWLHNFGYTDQKLSSARCQNGYGNKKNCLHPCRTLAASMAHHQFGQIVFMKELVGLKCGNRDRDGFEMIHDGFMIVQDTGSPKHFNTTGRFDFFWGRCKNYRNGVCFEGPVDISTKVSNKNYCVAWDPRTPTKNVKVKEWFQKTVRREDYQRGDLGAQLDLDLDKLPK